MRVAVLEKPYENGAQRHAELAREFTGRLPTIAAVSFNTWHEESIRRKEM